MYRIHIITSAVLFPAPLCRHGADIHIVLSFLLLLLSLLYNNMEVSRKISSDGDGMVSLNGGELDAGHQGYFQLWLKVTVTVSHDADGN